MNADLGSSFCRGAVRVGGGMVRSILQSFYFLSY
jgi:hypothetical protein